MREIKFRAWDVEDKAMTHDIKNISDQGGNWIRLQFTGRKDKNEKDIYEGDILKYAGSGNLWCGQKQIEVVTDMRIPFGNINLYEVIGNIYENPELLI